MNQPRIAAIDAVRGLASLAVCWFHLTAFHYPSPDQPVYQAIRATGTFGWLGVEMFFVISGFVIPYSLHRAGYSLASYPRFIARRLVRLDPPYLATIALLLALAYAHAWYAGRPPEIEEAPITAARVLLHLGYLNMFSQYPWLNPAFWTLAIEVQFYAFGGLAFPVIVSGKAAVRRVALLAFGGLAFLTARDAFFEGVPVSAYGNHFGFLFLTGIVSAG